MKCDKLPVSNVKYVIHKGKTKDFKLHTQAHAIHELIYLDYGLMHIVAGREEMVLEAGDCILIPGNTPHRFYGKGGAYDFLNVCFEGKFPPDIALKVVRLEETERKILLDMKNENLREMPCYQEIVLCRMNEFILRLKRRFETPKSRIGNKVLAGAYNSNYTEMIVSRVLNYIEQNYFRKLLASDVSAHAGISASYLRQLLRQKTGISLRQHILKVRMDNAEHFLRESTDNVQTIAARVGYESVSRFCEAFKKIYGMTPLEYSRSLGLPQEYS